MLSLPCPCFNKPTLDTAFHPHHEMLYNFAGKLGQSNVCTVDAIAAAARQSVAPVIQGRIKLRTFILNYCVYLNEFTLMHVSVDVCLCLHLYTVSAVRF